MPDDPRAALREALREFHAEMPGSCVEDAANAGLELAEAVRAYLPTPAAAEPPKEAVMVWCPRCNGSTFYVPLGSVLVDE